MRVPGVVVGFAVQSGVTGTTARDRTLTVT